ncbi:conserved hypothetical protein [Theileria orientalis strain Shintoku]|uniref:Uncharacterized protein n=1 Tax=Theileria orientalis strain Shintoku TaxID=869250 RepID=J4C842_THEOR|nr:conserved hypothetical protein [Theileria orientalis strain Shintoku]BAM40133.1 conserved hypothetical protein [Theileria orientalis strain Shintoku]|eukprot:XP_009690434.1 conserved hypothetical protein [Theileria orientalis strain Shintoku]
MKRDLESCKKIIRSKLYDYSSKFAYLAADDVWISDKIQHVSELLKRAVELRENLIILIRGQPSSGKTYLVRSSLLNVLSNPKNSDDGDNSARTHFIELCAYDYKDDVKCLRELLNHLEQIFGISRDPDSYMMVSQIQTAILHCLKLLKRNRMYLIIVIDGFEAFTKGKYDCSATTGSYSRRQGLLYFLSDSMQLKETCFTVIYVTSDLNCLDRLEKRVKSRFVYEPVYCFSDYDVTEYFNDNGESKKILDDCIVKIEKDKMASMALDSICGRDRNMMSIDVGIALLMMKEDDFKVKEDGGKTYIQVPVKKVSLKCVSDIFETQNVPEDKLVFEHLNLPEHCILVSLTRLHIRGVYPQTLNAVIEDLKQMVAEFPKERFAVPNPEGLRRTFMELVNNGLVEWVNYTQNNIDNVRVEHSVNDPSGFGMPCRFPKYREYVRMDLKELLPTHLSQWLSMADRTL